jgi:uridine phosphorylase
MIPIVRDKYNEKSITNPIDYLKKCNKYKNLKIPQRCIITYSYLSKIIENILSAGKINYKKNNNFFILENTPWIFLSSVSAPNVVRLIEELRVFGVKEIINTGICGGISLDLSIGDIIIVDCAFRDEGTSYHYIKPSKISYPSKKLFNEIKKKFILNKIDFKKGCVWTTDAPYRETEVEIKYFRDKGVLCVDMESSAIFSVCKYYNIKASSVLVVSDLLLDNKWRYEFNLDFLGKSFEKIFYSFLKSVL